MFDIGKANPREMPSWFFSGAISLNYSKAVRANISAQDFSVCPRYWYIDAVFHCGECQNDFVWRAHEQKTWFERYHLYVDAHPSLCRPCRRKRHHAVRLRNEYDALVTTARESGTLEQKRRIMEIIDHLEAYLTRIPDRMRETRDVFRRQLARRGD